MEYLAYIGIFLALILLGVFVMWAVDRLRRRQIQREQAMVLVEPFPDHEAFHQTDLQEFRYFWSMYVFCHKYPGTRLTLHFSHFPTIDDVYRLINKKYGKGDARIDHFRQVIWNLPFPEKPAEAGGKSEVTLFGNSITISHDIMTEN